MDPNTGRLRALSEDESSMLSMMKKAENSTIEEKALSDELKGLEGEVDKVEEGWLFWWDLEVKD